MAVSFRVPAPHPATLAQLRLVVITRRRCCMSSMDELPANDRISGKGLRSKTSDSGLLEVCDIYFWERSPQAFKSIGIS